MSDETTETPKTDAVGGQNNEIVMRDLQKSDCVYENNFPANIEWGLPVVVQITESRQGVVLYTCKLRGTQSQCFLPLNLCEKYTNDLYIFGA